MSRKAYKIWAVALCCLVGWGASELGAEPTSITLTLETTQQADSEASGTEGIFDAFVAKHPTEWFETAWNFKLLQISGRDLTPGNLVVGFLILVLGLLVVRGLVRGLRHRLVRQTHMTANTAVAIEKMANYIGVLLVFFTALKVMNIPLTVFAFFGGALAIAVGLGAQQIINNFISGPILMLEQPIRVGDLVEVDGTYGEIEEIGARCTRMRSFNNIHLLIPNSKLLENTVINWTHSDQNVRVMISVGVAYGSPVGEVLKLLKQAATEIEKIHTHPEPIVIFKDFGDNALIFETHFWLSMRNLMDRWKVESAFRERVDSLFMSSAITIAYPQRDVHLDTPKPITVRLEGDRNRMI